VLVSLVPGCLRSTIVGKLANNTPLEIYSSYYQFITELSRSVAAPGKALKATPFTANCSVAVKGAWIPSQYYHR
jgi:hypothetical protein